jgi:hypothetical protein
MENKFSPEELPYSQFKKLGMDKETVLNLPKSDLQKLLRGDKTDIMDLKLNDNFRIPSEVKLSLIRESDNTVKLLVHPYRKEILNEFSLDKEQMEKLKNGGIVEGMIKAKNGELKPHIFQLDKELNEIMKVTKDSIRIPDKINDVKLSNEQKEQIASGKSVSIEGKNGTSKVELNLNDSKGIRIDSPLGYERNGRLDTAVKNDLKM